jgi:hypothetical protein
VVHTQRGKSSVNFPRVWGGTVPLKYTTYIVDMFLTRVRDELHGVSLNEVVDKFSPRVWE